MRVEATPRDPSLALTLQTKGPVKGAGEFENWELQKDDLLGRGGRMPIVSMINQLSAKN